MEHQALIDQSQDAIRQGALAEVIEPVELADHRHPPLDRQVKQRLGVLEVAVDRPQRDSGACCHVLHRGREVALHEHLVDGVEHGVAVAPAPGAAPVLTLGHEREGTAYAVAGET